MKPSAAFVRVPKAAGWPLAARDGVEDKPTDPARVGEAGEPAARGGARDGVGFAALRRLGVVGLGKPVEAPPPSAYRPDAASAIMEESAHTLSYCALPSRSAAVTGREVLNTAALAVPFGSGG